MVSKNKLIKEGIKYTDKLFDEISKRLEQGVQTSDTLEAFLEKYNKAFPDKGNPLVTLGYDAKMLELILQETNNHKFSRPSQKELTRVTIENTVGELIVNVGDDIRDSVRDIVKYGYDNNLSQDEIATNISNRVNAIKGKRAKAIARTEIARTATISDYVINKERGATHFYVECRNTACPVCKHAWHEGWTLENDDSFKPSDESAGGRGWIGDKYYSMESTDKLPPIHPNCRCVAYFVNEADKGVKIVNEQPVTTSTVTETVETDITKEPASGLSIDELNEKSFQELADYYGLEYRGIDKNPIDNRNYHYFVEVFDDDRRLSIHFEEGAVKSYLKGGIATPNEIIAEVMKVPKSLRNETNSIWFKNTTDGVKRKPDLSGYSKLDANTYGHNIVTEGFDDYHHDIGINSRFFKGKWKQEEDKISEWKFTIHHEFEHSGDYDKALWESDDYMPYSLSDDYLEAREGENYFTEYANSDIGEAWAEHGGYISYMEANPSEQNKLLTIYVSDEESGFIEKGITYEEYKKMYPKQYNFFINRHKG